MVLFPKGLSDATAPTRGSFGFALLGLMVVAILALPAPALQKAFIEPPGPKPLPMAGPAGAPPPSPAPALQTLFMTPPAPNPPPGAGRGGTRPEPGPRRRAGEGGVGGRSRQGAAASTAVAGSGAGRGGDRRAVRLPAPPG